MSINFKYTLFIDQRECMRLGITNINQAIIFDLLSSASKWAKTIVIDGEVYYWVARQAISKQLPILDLKPDTVYRHLKKLAELGVITHLKSGKKDCIKLTKLGKSYYVGNKSELKEKPYVGNESENDQNSEMNPSKLGNESENNSDLNPTYKTTSIYKNKNNKKLNSKELSIFLENKFTTLWQNNSFEKVGKDNAKKAYIKLCKTRWKTEEKISEATDFIIKDIAERFDYIGERKSPLKNKHLSSYLNQKGWQDESTEIWE